MTHVSLPLIGELIFGPDDAWRDGFRTAGGSHEEHPIQKAQIVKILREADKAPVVEVVKRHRISDHTTCLWRKRFSGLGPVDMKRLRALEFENARPKKLVAERGLEIEIMKEVVAKKAVGAPARRRHGRMRASSRPVASHSARAAVGDPVEPSVSLQAGREGRSGRGIAVLSRLVNVHGASSYLRSNYGPEFESRAVLRRLAQTNIDTARIDSGKPWQKVPTRGSRQTCGRQFLATNPVQFLGHGS